MPGHKTWGLTSDFDPLTADADEVVAVCCDLAQKDNAYDDDDLLTLLFNVGIEVCEPTYPDSFSSLVHCYVQWFVRDKWILDPLDEEQQQRIVDHVVFKLLYDNVHEVDKEFREKMMSLAVRKNSLTVRGKETHNRVMCVTLVEAASC